MRNFLPDPLFRISLVAALVFSTAGCQPQGATPAAPPPPASLEQPTAAAQEAAPSPTPAKSTRAAFCPEALPAGSPLPAGARAELIRDGFVFLEGPVWVDSLGALLFSEMDFNANGDQGPPSTIHRLVPPSTFDVFLESSGSNGLAVDGTGLLLCAHDTQTVTRLDPATRKRSVLAVDFAGKKFNSPNDLTVRSSGDIYFTDPDWQIGKRKKETGVTGVYRRAPSGAVSLVDGQLDKPNGIALSPAEDTLYVGAVDGRVYAYTVSEDGTPGERRVFAEVPEPDGMAVDCAGNLYVTSHGPGEIVLLSAAGQRLDTVPIGPRTTNAAFGGADHQTLFVTAGQALYRLQTRIPGYPY